MTWLFSKALMEDYANSLSSQALAAESLAANSLDGEPYAQLNVMPTPHKFWRNDKTMEFSNLSRFGLTLRLLTESLGEAVLMSYLAAFPVKTLASRGGAKGLKVSAAGYGENSNALLAKWNPMKCMWKIPQRSLFEDLEQSLEIWPRSGSMRNGECYLQPMLMPHTLEKGFGYWATPAASDATRGGTLTEKMTGQSLAQMVNTPKRWPTATATAYKGWSQNHNRALTDDRLDYSVEREAALNRQTGRLNPTWVEWLMGWTLEWTALKPLAMDKYLEWQQQHSLSLQNEPELSEEAA